MRVAYSAACVLWAILSCSSASGQDLMKHIEARQSAMSYVGSNMRTLAGMAQGRTEFNVALVKMLEMPYRQLRSHFRYCFRTELKQVWN